MYANQCVHTDACITSNQRSIPARDVNHEQTNKETGRHCRGCFRNPVTSRCPFCSRLHYCCIRIQFHSKYLEALSLCKDASEPQRRPALLRRMWPFPAGIRRQVFCETYKRSQAAHLSSIGRWRAHSQTTRATHAQPLQWGICRVPMQCPARQSTKHGILGRPTPRAQLTNPTHSQPYNLDHQRPQARVTRRSLGACHCFTGPSFRIPQLCFFFF